MSGEIYITETDRIRLQKLIQDEQNKELKTNKSIEELNCELKKAKVVGSEQIPQNVVTMNSRVLLELDNDDVEISLVYPKEADFTSQKLSILSPIGTAILGYREGESVKWSIPSGVAEIRIKKILYQPEAAGDYHL